MKKLISPIIALTIFLIIFLIIYIYNFPNSSVTKEIKKQFPISFKTYIRDTFFIISEKNKEIKNLRSFSLQLIEDKNKLNEKIILNIEENKIIKNNLELIKYKLPFYSRDYSNKTVAHIDVFKNKLLLGTGTGTFFYAELHSNSKQLILNKIKNNLTSIISDMRFYDSTMTFLNSDEISIKDLLVDNLNLYISYIKEVETDCFNVSILKSDLNINFLKFETFFTFEECLSFKNIKEFNGQQSGGRIVKYKDTFLLSLGEFRKRTLAQNKNSNFGKILQIDQNGKKIKNFSLGHRNPQGLFYDKENKVILSTEHGPLGGDEINLIKENNNYGWPISSYGDHYDGSFKKNAPLYKSHKDHGFVEPLYFFNPSIGISEIIKAEKFYDDIYNYYLVTSLRNKTLYIFKEDKNFVEFSIKDKVYIGERIRDIIYYKELDKYLMILEETPAIVFLSKI